MEFIDQAGESSTAEGTGDLTLDGPITGFQTLPTGEFTYVASMGSEWELGVSQVSGGVLERPIPHLYLAGNSNGYAGTSDAAALSITGDIDVRFHGALNNWTNGQTFVSKRNGFSSAVSYHFEIGFGNTLSLRWSADGTTVIGPLSTQVLSIAAGATKHVRATLDVDNGSGGYTLNYYTSDDGSTWTQLGATIIGGATTSIFDGTQPLIVGSYAQGASNRMAGKVYSVQVRDGIDGTLVANPRFDQQNTNLFTDAQGNVWSTSGSSAEMRGIVLTSSNSGQRVSFSAGIKKIYLTTPSEYLERPKIETFTSSSTYVKPSWAKRVHIYMISDGGGGGSGRRGAAGTVRCGGGGGASGCVSWTEFDAADLADGIAITVGQGGAGGAAATVDNANGSAGSAGTGCSFGTYLYAPGGNGGGGGTNSGGGAGTAVGVTSRFQQIGFAGGAASNTGGTGSASAVSNTGVPTGGAAGGGIQATDVRASGGSGGSISVSIVSISTAGGSLGSAGSAGSNGNSGAWIFGITLGTGGGGGAGNNLAAAGNGGNGGNYGAGGGGGGASLNGFDSGAGGNGAPGVVVVVTE